ncbi:unnamed protein product [Lasius platythorax]|uniref:Uncharacterized protein n=1 Tax=Lasius platythorax TaxID=488582 RepID=A0AAV2NKP9_9HYME
MRSRAFYVGSAPRFLKRPHANWFRSITGRHTPRSLKYKGHSVFARTKSITGQLAGMFFEAPARRILVIHRVPYLSENTLRSPTDPGLMRYIKRRFVHYPAQSRENDENASRVAPFPA